MPFCVNVIDEVSVNPEHVTVTVSTNVTGSFEVDLGTEFLYLSRLAVTVSVIPFSVKSLVPLPIPDL